ncbi:MAG: heme-copper oxidase subunit III [Pseudanabaenaceae cyanobacterium bins.39]|nr:heme-copper oxidase subunit III [Pseudanabaenaceae cyanobacterium bins.39]
MQGSIATNTSAEAITHDHGAVAGHAEHPDLRVFGLIVFLISEGMLFFGLFAAYLTFRSVATAWPPEGTPELELLLPGINTIILVSSSFVIHQADAAIKENKVKSAQLWFLATFVMGAIFIAGQIYEYQHLEFGLTSNLFASTFYVLTGFHGLHVIIGLSLIATVLVRSLKSGHYSNTSHFGIEAASIYWHFVDIVWIILFLLLYIL